MQPIFTQKKIFAIQDIFFQSPRLVVEDSALAITCLSATPYSKIAKENTTLQ